MAARGGPDRVALLHEITGGCDFVSDRPMTHLDGALVDREVRARRDDRALRKKDTGPRSDEHKRCGECRDECERTATRLLDRHRRYRDEGYKCGRVRVVDRVTNFGERRRDNL